MLDLNLKNELEHLIREEGPDPYNSNPKILVDELDKFASSPLADRKFVSELETGVKEGDINKVFQCVSEAEFARLLQEDGWELKSSNSGPDFIGQKDGKTVYFEVITPMPIDVPEDTIRQNWEDVEDDETGMKGSISVGNFPQDQILLRLTSAVKAKSEKFVNWLDKGSIEADPLRIIVVSTMLLGMNAGMSINKLPSIVNAVYPAGNPKLLIDINTRKVVDRQITERTLKNKNDSKIPTDGFIEDAYDHVDAVIGLFNPKDGAIALNKSNERTEELKSIRILDFPQFQGSETDGKVEIAPV